MEEVGSPPAAREATGLPLSVFLLLARIVAGGALVLAAVIKLRGGPLILQMSVEGFKIVPEGLALPIAYMLPWAELVAGVALVLGLWTRQAGLLVTCLYAVFTIGLLSVLARGMDVDCGCFGGMFGESKVGAGSIIRNSVFIALSALCLVRGGGRFSLTKDR